MKPEYYKNEKNVDIIDFCKMYDLNFNRGNILKYIARAGKKENEIEDLKKAMEYLKREIDFLEVKNINPLHTILVNFWDFMDKDCTANRNEYTEKEQNELLESFISKL